ncbi:MAG TPA: hypothetical protein VLK85_37385 [Ramlibacter sp.]|nr:hypothetical protein [Ramlibacter sp.]
MKEKTMTRYLRTALGAIAAVGVVLVASAAIANPGGMQGGMGAGMGRHHHGMHGQMSGSENVGGKGRGGGRELMTPAERKALHEKMRAARTPEERQALAAATRAEMEKGAKEKGIELPDQRGPGGRGQAPGTGSGGHQH